MLQHNDPLSQRVEEETKPKRRWRPTPLRYTMVNMRPDEIRHYMDYPTPESSVFWSAMWVKHINTYESRDLWRSAYSAHDKYRVQLSNVMHYRSHQPEY